MNFHTFLNDLGNELNCNSATKLYKKLGGKAKLDIGLRQFQIIFSGQSKPTTALLMAVLRNVEFGSYRTALQAFFQSVAGEEDSNFLNYLEVGLRESIRPPDKQQWKNIPEVKLYTEEQIHFLKSNSEALRIHQKILLLNEIPIRDEESPIIEQLCKIKLAKIANNRIVSTAEAFKIPSEFNSLPRTTRLASEYIVESMRTFLSFEGSESQKLDMITQAISKEDLPHILDETAKLKKWIQSLGQKEIVEGSSVPFIYIGFAKGLVKGEIR